ncbi:MULTISPECIES: hypothetical protein [unclassified Corallococcus]|uniref:hypothetical protein n=1 Tax=unclassified Corallococcus TaxID=2685029 RepID=UPI001A8FB5C4|nr:MULTISPECIES: hypothetical protein [unclassified Corallococcus]MBN9682275.1 hypothetical protein [Corallococcus sp. NCSPR001]WAS86169.1 hypothetical protein O0N60_04155 [Corallococcus sp. NCRR]
MSGPKVIRIVTREELEAIGRQQLNQVADAVQELSRCAKRHGLLDAQLEERLQQHQGHLERLFQDGNWAALREQAAREVAFLDSERERFQAQAIAAAELARSKRHRMEASARTLLAAFTSARKAPPPQLERVVSGVRSADEATMRDMQAVISEALRALPVESDGGASANQMELAGLLAMGLRGQRFTDWLEQQVPLKEGSIDARLRTLLAEIEALEDAEVARPFLERASAIAQEIQPGRRALLTDSLMLDVSAHRRARQSHENVVASLRNVRSGLMALESPTARTMGARIADAVERETFGAMDALLQEATTTLEAERKEASAAARRHAILSGLTALGYEVRESMTVAWPKQGRLVVRKPGVADYGIELGAPADAARVQVRLVGSNGTQHDRKPERDRDMETVWCGEFQQLRERLKEEGTEVIVERAVEAGVQPVKSVYFDEPSPSADDLNLSDPAASRTLR